MKTKILSYHLELEGCVKANQFYQIVTTNQILLLKSWICTFSLFSTWNQPHNLTNFIVWFVRPHS